VERFDLAVIGAGAAGLFCAGIAGQRGLKVLLLDHAEVLGEKIRISGGGRCNFTNVNAGNHERYVSSDSRFARQALRAYPPQRFVDLVRRHRIAYHEKHLGQLFCDDTSRRIIDLLMAECAAGKVTIRHPVRVNSIEREATGDCRFVIVSDEGRFGAANLVVATGGLSIPALGASDFGWRQAAAWGLDTVAARPGLVPLTFAANEWRPFAELAGVSLPVNISVVQAPDAGRAQRAPSFREDLLFTHRGLSGPAILQVSSYWRPGQRLDIDLIPEIDVAGHLIDVKSGTTAGATAGEGYRQQVATVLGRILPRRLAQVWITATQAGEAASLTGQERLAEAANGKLRSLGQSLNRWQLQPAGSEGYRKAEVTLGGVATRELDPRTLQALRVPGLHCIGEAVDVTGWLGGYNFQWAWASAYAAAMSMQRRPDAPA
jgi:predicted Rossmann fold flavoprotein